MATRAQVRELLESGHDYDAVGRLLGIRPGQAYLIATGLPADGGDAPDTGSSDRPYQRPDSQQLANPEEAENPTSKSSVIEWIKTRVAADAPMRGAAERRDAAPGEPQETDEVDVVDVLTRDHNQVKAMLEQMSTIPGKVKGGSAAQMSARKSIVDMITVALSKHEAVEEEHFWPAVRGWFPNGEQWAEPALQQEQEGKDILTALGKLSGDDEDFDELVEKLTLAARTHVAYEETLFLHVREHVSEEDRKQLGATIQKARKRAPTRPHPHAPKHSPAVKAAGMAGAAMDKVRDEVGHRPAERRGKAAPDAGAETVDDAAGESAQGDDSEKG